MNISNLPSKVHICNDCHSITVSSVEIDNVKCRECNSLNTYPIDISSYNTILLSVIGSTITDYIKSISKYGDDLFLKRFLYKDILKVVYLKYVFVS